MKKLLIGILCSLSLGVQLFGAIPAVGSREYKLMLDPALFNGATPETVVSAFESDLRTIIANSINRAVTGSLTLDKLRTVRFYDTPGSCLLYTNSLIFREREESGVREVTLKYRNPDRFVSGHQDMSGTESDAVTKFEEDLSAPFSSKYSHATTQGISATKNLNYLDDPIRLYPGLLDYNFDDTLPILIVGDITIVEKVYKQFSVDLGSLNGDFSLTLWYDSSNLTAPVVAEISFKYKDAAEDYTQKVVTRAQNLFYGMQGMSGWLSSSSTTKTGFVYGFDPDFCQ